MSHLSRLTHRFWFFVLIAGATLGARAETAERPKLVVAISIDQFRADYLERFKAHFGERGFRLFLEQGAYFSDCHYRHSHTKTGCGHAVMLTGVHADKHGIIGNDWMDRGTFEWVSCVGDPAQKTLGLPDGAPPVPGVDNPYLARSPKNLMVTTVGDELKLARGGKPKVIGLSTKDRAAILMSGKLADAAYYFEYGQVVSSTYYMPDLPAWVKAWNAQKKVDSYFGKTWERLLPEAAYAIQGPDDQPGEDDKIGALGRTLPKVVTGGEAKLTWTYYDAFDVTPFGNEVLADFARETIVQEKLGQREGVTDILCVSFSANDYIGHAFGPDSHEIMDNVVRMDRVLADFFAFLDDKIGAKNYTLVLTADHGASPMPEVLHRARPDIPAGRLNMALINQTAQDALVKAFGPLADKSAWAIRDDATFHLYPAALAEKKVAAEDAQKVIRDALLKLDFIAAAYTRADLERGALPTELGRQVQLSFNLERSGDVFYQTKPYFYNKKAGTTHGAPYNYDTHVPLLWYGVGVKPGSYVERVGVDDLAPTLAHLLGLPSPPQSNGRILF